MQMLETLSALSNIATAIGVGVAAYQLRITRKQNITAFEDSLSGQYRQIVSTLPLKALLGESLSDQEHCEHLQYFYRYIDLCNEQVFLHKSRRISNKTWLFWGDGILTNLSRPAFARAWQEIANRAKDDFDELRLLCPPKSTPSTD
jgi:hypothetical protein